MCGPDTLPLELTGWIRAVSHLFFLSVVTLLEWQAPGNCYRLPGHLLVAHLAFPGYPVSSGNCELRFLESPSKHFVLGLPAEPATPAPLKDPCWNDPHTVGHPGLESATAWSTSFPTVEWRWWCQCTLRVSVAQLTVSSS